MIRKSFGSNCLSLHLDVNEKKLSLHIMLMKSITETDQKAVKFCLQADMAVEAKLG